jgi:hypothetical protein
MEFQFLKAPRTEQSAGPSQQKQGTSSGQDSGIAGDVTVRLPTTLPADGNEDRYLMSETETFRTANGFPRWSMTRYAAARPNTWPALHSAPRASPKLIVNAQSKPVSQTGGRNNVIPEPCRLPHTHISAIKSP